MSHLGFDRKIGLVLRAASHRQRAAVTQSVWRCAASDRRELGLSFGLLYRARAVAVLAVLRHRPAIGSAICANALDIDRFVRTV